MVEKEVPEVVNTETAGGSRYSAGKAKTTWAPWRGMLEVCKVSEMGAKKYAEFDWLNGQSFSTLLSSAMRHLIACERDPLSVDPESGLYHAAHAGWNIMALLDFINQGRAEEMDDVTPWKGVTSVMKKEALRLVAETGIHVFDALRLVKAPEEEIVAVDPVDQVNDSFMQYLDDIRQPMGRALRAVADAAPEDLIEAYLKLNLLMSEYAGKDNSLHGTPEDREQL